MNSERSGTLRIAVEEAFATPELFASWRRALRAGGPEDPCFRHFYADLLDSPSAEPLRARLLDVDAGRIDDMQRSGVDVQILSVTAPGVQVSDAGEAQSLSSRLNDELAEWIAARPDRFSGLAAIAPHAPAAAAREIERAVGRLGLRGVIVNSSTGGRYLDEPEFDPILETASALRVPLYLHPSTPSPRLGDAYLAHGLEGPMWGFAAEAGLHALRMILGGVFERHPNLCVVLGHLGEGIPFWLDRIDAKYRMLQDVLTRSPRRRLSRSPSECFAQNFVVTTSGMPWRNVLEFTLERLGPERVLFAADYPYESSAQAVAAIEALELSESDRQRIFAANALEVFGLNAASLRARPVCAAPRAVPGAHP